ncbi:HAD family hydrolase [Caldisericum exile]|uniref:Hydrolase n=1 Tax=Caldisericum exile (strain DSM 21853 / NBRC 104410 / AZM16c01) TaxID=511051 RepID=A0A7U6JFJ4_CALEA|nr:HAD family hydrolase [Caldisericum exile]BAL80509.1 putative hydrolase [Caldisericum exile AZM16c01]
MIKALTIDLWETLIEDKDSNELERDKQRARFIIKELNLNDERIDDIMRFFTDLTEAFKHPSPQNSWSILPEDQVKMLLENYLKVPYTDAQFEKIVEYYKTVILENPPILTEQSVPKVLMRLSKKYTLVLISNTGRTPGNVLLNILEMYGIRDYFAHFIFSDEIGVRKPDPRVFDYAKNLLNLEKEAVVHIGDSVNLDFMGAKSYGFNAILYAKGKDNPQVEPYVKSFEELERVLNEKFN